MDEIALFQFLLQSEIHHRDSFVDKESQGIFPIGPWKSQICKLLKLLLQMLLLLLLLCMLIFSSPRMKIQIVELLQVLLLFSMLLTMINLSVHE